MPMPHSIHNFLPIKKESAMQTRRKTLTQGAAVASLLAGTGLFPQLAHAFNAPAFDAKNMADVMKALGAAAPQASKDVTLTAPDIAENGAVVPMGVATTLAGVKTLLLLVEKNPSTLVASFAVTDAVEASMKSMEDLTEMTRANVDALIASAKAATAGVEQVVTHLTEVSKKSFEDTTAMVKTLASAKTPNELMQLQSDFAKTQFDNAVAEYSKLTEMMIKLAGEVMEPVQNQVAVATDKLKSAWKAK